MEGGGGEDRDQTDILRGCLDWKIKTSVELGGQHKYLKAFRKNKGLDLFDGKCSE